MAEQRNQPACPPPGARYRGEVVYLYAYDVAYELDTQAVTALLGRPGEPFSTGASRRVPKEAFFYRPRVFALPPAERVGPHGPIHVHGTVKLFHVGAISIAVHVPFAVDRLEDLVGYHDLRFQSGPLQAEVRAMAERILADLRPHCVRPAAGLRDDEAYTVFCLQAPLPEAPGAPPGERAACAGAEAWLKANHRLVAALLTEEPDMERLSLQEARESTGLYLSYYEHDLSVIDWDAALLVDRPENFEEMLHVAELANVQLAELGVFDLILDEALDRAYRDLRRLPGRAKGEFRRGWRSAADVRRDLREIRIDLERLHDELFNTTKFFGDWHLARLYQHLSSRFHLADWSRVIEGKLRTLGEMYTILKQDQSNRIMIVLEGLIVLLFIIDVIILLAGLKG